MHTEEHVQLLSVIPVWMCPVCVLQCKRRDQQGDDGHPGFLQSQGQTGGVTGRVGEHTLLQMSKVFTAFLCT